MAKFATKEDEEDALKECVNCGSRNSNINLTGELLCDNCHLNPNTYIDVYEGYLKDIYLEFHPDHELKFKLLKEKERINTNDFVVILGYTTEEAGYWYSIECFDDYSNLTEYLYNNFTGSPEDDEDDITRHVIKMYYKGMLIGFHIELDNLPKNYYIDRINKV